ncbi:BACON domain-containing protein [Tenacibaculum agarivorans]|uniref:BACON domain-containing protein n=1 Tax=Tenacibaculum agarivorans TaxID=1908389 RepID=UPI000B1C9EA8|nr:BACON domain-containing protein [Tenacibaculum agarivorans]
MALPISGKISIKDILIEMGQPTRTNVSLDTLAAEWALTTGDLTFASQEHKLSDWLGKSWRVSIDIGFLTKFRLSVQGNPSDGLGMNRACDLSANRTMYHNGITADYRAPNIGAKVYNVLGLPFNGQGYSYKTEQNKVIKISSNGIVESIHNCITVTEQLSISPTQIDDVPSRGSRYTISVTCNGAWTARVTRGATDSSITRASGTGNGSFTLIVNGVSGGIQQLQYLSGDVTVTSGSKSVTLRWFRTHLLLDDDIEDLGGGIDRLR